MDFKTNGIVIASLLVSMVASSSVHRLKRDAVAPTAEPEYTSITCNVTDQRVVIACHAETKGSFLSCPDPLCQGRTGDFSVADDCTKYLSCWEGYGTVKECPSDLVFVERTGYCDWPSDDNTKNCAYKIAKDVDPVVERKLEQIHQICRQLPVRANATHVAHPDFCNAYVVCGNGVATTPCEVCSVGTFFPNGADRCGRYDGELECPDKQVVQFNDLVGVRARDANCNPIGSLQPLPKPTPQY